MMSFSYKSDRLTSRTATLFAVMLVLALISAACGPSDQSDNLSSSNFSRGEITTSASDETEARQVSKPDAEQNKAANETKESLQPLSRPARRLLRQSNELQKAYRPASRRINFVVTADTMRREAIEAGYEAAVVDERTGALRVEIQRSRSLLKAAKLKVEKLRFTHRHLNQIRRLMVTAINQRLIALNALEDLLDEADREQQEALSIKHQAAMNASSRAAREATTSLQELHKAAGLPPVSEESVR